MPTGPDATDRLNHNLICTMYGAQVLSLSLLTGENGFPVGVSIIARNYADYLWFDFAHHLEMVPG